MKTIMKKSVNISKLIIFAIFFGFLSIIVNYIGNVIDYKVALIWGMLFILASIVLSINENSNFSYFVLIYLCAFTSECIMQLQIEHSFQLLFTYQRVLDFLLYYFVFLLFGTIAKSKSSGLIIGNIFFFLISSINFAITVFRGKPIYFPDLFSINTAINIVGEYSFPMSKVYFVCIFLYIACVILCVAYKKNYNDCNGRFREKFTKSGLLILIPIMIVFCRIPTQLNLRSYYFTTTQYWLYSFSMSAYQMFVEVPETYNYNEICISEKSDVNDLYEIEKPNVIFIMNESFADLRVISSFEKDDEVMPFFDELKKDKNSASGNLHVSIMGGNTANTEFEVLTGVSMNNLPYDTTAYNLYLNSKTPSLANYFNQLGYRTIAFHPSAKNNYNRNIVYPNLGFQEFYFEEDYTDLKKLRTFASDISNYEHVVEMFENKEKEEKLFLFNVTVQNHGPFTFADSTFNKAIDFKNESFEITEQYLSCLKYSDDALKYLIEYFNNYHEPVILCFFGDHQAKIDDAFYEMLYRKSLSSLTDEETEKRYIVPYLIWTNYDSKMQSNYDVSANYLGTYVIEQIGFPQTGYQKYLNKLRLHYPIITAQTIKKSDLTENISDEEIVNYKNICYNLLFDKNNLWKEIYQLDFNER